MSRFLVDMGGGPDRSPPEWFGRRFAVTDTAALIADIVQCRRLDLFAPSVSLPNCCNALTDGNPCGECCTTVSAGPRRPLADHWCRHRDIGIVVLPGGHPRHLQSRGSP